MQVIREGARKYMYMYSAWSAFWRNRFACSSNVTCAVRDKARIFLKTRTATEENISRARTVLSPRFLYYSSVMEKRYLLNVNVVVQGLAKSENCSLPVAVHVSKPRVLKLPIE